MDRIDRIRQKEIDYHDDLYKKTPLFEEGSWLAKPAGVVETYFHKLPAPPTARILDLGSGVGRNSIPLAQMAENGSVTAVDFLERAISELKHYAKKYDVAERIQAVQSEIEAFPIEAGTYDYIIGVSSIEHVKSKEELRRLLDQLQLGTKPGGIHCFIMNTRTQDEQVDGEEDLSVEVNMSTNEALELLNNSYSDWEKLHEKVKTLSFSTDPDDMNDDGFQSQALTYVVQKPFS
ncbi:class I SAM-dependent methyltransferase [Bacillus daqingensis]|uniref:Class I SAM-dependent methyltransferase n=1 Tax=Bacillus daqingensis TaxID=872396 RepID=A0ABV9P1G8_9BACI